MKRSGHVIGKRRAFFREKASAAGVDMAARSRVEKITI